MGVGPFMRRQREALNLSQKEVAIHSQLSQAYISKLERGEVGLPQRATLEKLAKALSTDVPTFWEAAGIVGPQYTGATQQGETSALDDVTSWVQADAELEEQLKKLRAHYQPEAYQLVIRQLAEAWSTDLKSLVAMLIVGIGHPEEDSVGAKSQEAAFEDAMLGIYEEAKRECKYNATRFLQLIRRYGGVAAAKRLLNTAAIEISPGLQKLWECGKIEISMEALVLREQWRGLFTEQELRAAKSRLDLLG